MKKSVSLFFCIILNLIQNLAFTQTNLVPNPGFEIIDSCNIDAGSSMIGSIAAGHAPPWDSPNTASPDLFNICAPLTCPLTIPSNVFGYQFPHYGSGYVGEEFYSPSSTYREYIQVELDSVLTGQQYYCISFFVNCGSKEKIASNNFGMYFSDSHIHNFTTNVLNYIPQINDTSIITDSTNWIEIMGVYRAHGGERYIIIGNFYSNVLTDTVHTNYGIGNGGYYYIDDVSVMRCSGSGVGEVTKPPNFKLYPNPNSGSFTFEYQIEGKENSSFSIYSIEGRLVKQQVLNSGNNKIQINVVDLNQGIYYYVVKEGGENVITEKLVIVK